MFAPRIAVRAIMVPHFNGTAGRSGRGLPSSGSPLPRCCLLSPLAEAASRLLPVSGVLSVFTAVPLIVWNPNRKEVFGVERRAEAARARVNGNVTRQDHVTLQALSVSACSGQDRYTGYTDGRGYAYAPPITHTAQSPRLPATRTNTHPKAASHQGGGRTWPKHATHMQQRARLTQRQTQQAVPPT